LRILDEASRPDGRTLSVVPRAASDLQARDPARPNWRDPEVLKKAMQDLVMLLFTAVFFGLAFLYVAACEKLR